MNSKRIEKLIPLTFEVLRGSDIIKSGTGGKKEIESKYFGYIASFGNTVNNAGMLKTLLFYEIPSDNNDESADREKINNLILNILKKYNGTVYGSYTSLLKAYLGLTESGDTANSELKNDIKKRILEAALALKFVMNTYNKREDKKSE